MVNVESLIQKYNIKPPFISKGFHAKFYPIDFVQLLWNKWGEYSGYYYKLHISTLENEYWNIYYFPEEFTKLRNQYFGILEDNKDFSKKHYNDWAASCEKLREKINILDSAFNDGKNFSEVLRKYKEFVDEYIFEYALSAPIQEACGLQPEQWIIPEIKNYVEKYNLDYQTTFALLTSPIVNSFVTQEEIELLKIASEYQKGRDEKVLGIAISQHQIKWFWAQNNYADIKKLDIDFFKTKLKEMLRLSQSEIEAKISHLENSSQITKDRKQEIFERCSPSVKLQMFVDLNTMFAEMQDVRKSFVLIANYYHKIFLEFVADTYKQPVENLWFYTYQELINSIDKDNFIDIEEVQRRKGMIVEIESKDEKVVLSGDEARFLYNRLQQKVDQVSSFKGLVAQAGKVSGQAKIVLKSEDIGKVSDGDIIVSSMTRPEMTAAMKKAAAFVTDEGGITCHAAIVSRELKKPSIIGTKIATQVLKDGDMVEVDANNGTVKVLKKVANN